MARSAVLDPVTPGELLWEEFMSPMGFRRGIEEDQAVAWKCSLIRAERWTTWDRIREVFESPTDPTWDDERRDFGSPRQAR